MTLFALGVLLIRNIWVLGSNVTAIEGWEIERHETLVRRARTRGGYLDGPDGVRLKITKQEFPYDIGIYQNARQAMGTTFLLWLWPLAPTPPNAAVTVFETNGFEEPNTSWPPPDPDRMPRVQFNIAEDDPFVYKAESSGLDVEAFRQRQRKDNMRFKEISSSSTPSEASQGRSQSSINDKMDQQHSSGAPGLKWRDSAGDNLWDLGVDEDAEEDNVPLAELLRRRKLGR
ncbi:MAG: hypothetical protein Q9170_004107 [Blastenia crenularia]